MRLVRLPTGRADRNEGAASVLGAVSGQAARAGGTEYRLQWERDSCQRKSGEQKREDFVCVLTSK